MESLKKFWRGTPKRVRQVIVFIGGGMVVISGIAMLVLPGPGWAAIFLGFAILATEFAFAEKARDWMVGKLKIIINFFNKIWDKFRAKR